MTTRCIARNSVTIYGDNSDPAYQYWVGETVQVSAVNTDTDYAPGGCEATVLATDKSHPYDYWACDILLSSDPATAVGLYTYTTLGLSVGVTEQGIFTDAADGATLDQYGNLPPPGWQNGN